MLDWRDKLRNPNCEICPLHKSTEYVCLMGSGPSQSKIMIVGEAPGKRETQDHQAFVGPAGQLLDIALEQHAGINREECHVTNVAKCRPPGNRTPDRKEIKACVESYFWNEVTHVKPRFMLLLGNSALQGVLKQSGIMKRSGTVQTKPLGGRTVQIMPTIHPAAVLRNPKNKDLFTSDIARFGRLVRGESANGRGTAVKIIRTGAQLRWLLSQLEDAQVISYDIETYVKPASRPFVRTSFQDWHGADSCIVSISFTWQEGQAAVIPIWHVNTPWKDPDRVLELLRPVLTRPDAKYVAHNGKFDARWLHSKGIPIKQAFDTMLAAHMLEENRPKGLKPLSRILLGVDAYDVGEDLGAAHRMPLRRLCIYNGKDTDYTYRLYKVFRDQLKEDERAARIFLKLMMPASNALVDIERYGVWVDPVRWQERYDQASDNVSKLYRYINKFVGPELRPINLNSHQQVAKWLYGDLGLPVVGTTDSGAPSSKEEVILELLSQEDHPALKALLKYRKWAKFLSTYLLPFWYEHRDSNGRIHSNYKLFGTVTGRLSGEGGIQQVPRDPFIRSIIGAPPGWVFLQADYSQIELRIAAMEANEHNMINQFLRGEDIHAAAASKRLGIPVDRLTKEERKKAKARNFGFLYAMGWAKFVKYCFTNWGLRITDLEAQADRRQFFEDYPAFIKWHERQRRLARRYGVVYSKIGRARHLPDILSQDEAVRAESERQGINSPIQSLASDLMLIALIRLHKILPTEQAHVVGSVHDALLFEVREDKAEEWAKVIKEVMEDMEYVEKSFNCDITVPVVADIDISSHWGGD